ncbi:hypothetical protein chiPu_0027803 [Chiloscyllium punctatum]|uniref:Uncharacterized protein n=1 Tax=Chiloscyllium punctatum TaxID=137246 RepID=A0A401TMC9_CHIPU|nr:hypothetical protein [Chiloscyllium punctatum]
MTGWEDRAAAALAGREVQWQAGRTARQRRSQAGRCNGRLGGPGCGDTPRAGGAMTLTGETTPLSGAGRRRPLQGWRRSNVLWQPCHSDTPRSGGVTAAPGGPRGNGNTSGPGDRTKTSRKWMMEPRATEREETEEPSNSEGVEGWGAVGELTS